MKKLFYAISLITTVGFSSMSFSATTYVSCEEAMLSGEFISQKSIDNHSMATKSFDIAVVEAKKKEMDTTLICNSVLNSLLTYEHASAIFLRSSQKYSIAMSTCLDESKKNDAKALIITRKTNGEDSRTNYLELKEFHGQNCKGQNYFDKEWLIYMKMKTI